MTDESSRARPEEVATVWREAADRAAAEENGPRDLAEERAAREGGLWPRFLALPSTDDAGGNQ